MIWSNLREEEFEDAIKRSGGVCIIPIGCTEKHGQHLPVGTDYFMAMHIAQEATKLEEAMIFPVGQWLGEVSGFHAIKDPGAMKLRGCIGIKQSTILTVLEELCDEIARNGFDKILIANCHGGNKTILKHFVRTQSYEMKTYATLSTFAMPDPLLEPEKLINTLTERAEDFPYITKEDMAVLESYREKGYGGGHADFRETAVVMSYNAKLVRPDKYDAESGISNHRTDYLSDMGIESPNAWLANFPTSYDGFAPHGCSETIGRAMTQIAAELLAEKIKVLKQDTDCVLSTQLLPPEKR